MNVIDFRYKIKVLSQVAPPAARKEVTRGPLIAVEGDSPEAANELATWLKDMLNNSDDLAAKLFDGPRLSASGDKEEVMAQYHRLAAEWLGKSRAVLESITAKVVEKAPSDAPMPDATSSRSPQSSRKLDENYDETDVGSPKGDKTEGNQSENDDEGLRSRSDAADAMEVDTERKRASTRTADSATSVRSVKPVSIIPNYSLHTSNVFACLIPLGKDDPYSPNDHWQWTATQWRGIIGPDLTIYVRDAAVGESGRPAVEIEGVDGRPDVGLFVVRKTKSDGQEGGTEARDEGTQVEASVLRRVGFEVSEWVRAFGTKTGKD